MALSAQAQAIKDTMNALTGAVESLRSSVVSNTETLEANGAVVSLATVNDLKAKLDTSFDVMVTIIETFSEASS